MQRARLACFLISKIAIFLRKRLVGDAGPLCPEQTAAHNDADAVRPLDQRRNALPRCQHDPSGTQPGIVEDLDISIAPIRQGPARWRGVANFDGDHSKRLIAVVNHAVHEGLRCHQIIADASGWPMLRR